MSQEWYYVLSGARKGPVTEAQRKALMAWRYPSCRTKDRRRSSCRNRKLRLESLECRRLLSGSVGDLVWNDLNGNGLQDGGEPGVAGAVVELFEDGVLRQKAVTDAAGQFAIDGLMEGRSHQLWFRPPVGFRFTRSDAGDESRDSDADASGLSPAFSLAPNQDDPTMDAGLIPVNEQFPVELEARVVLLNSGALGLSYFPDMNLTVLQNPPAMEVFTVAGNASYLLEGTDLQHLSKSTEVLRRGSAGEFDNGGAWICGKHQHSDGKLYVFYHAEDQENMPPIPGGIAGFYASIGVAVSTDNGRHFSKLGPVMTSFLPKNPMGSNPAQGIGECSVVADPTGQYLYAYYTDHSDVDGRGVQIGMARADVSQGAPMPGAWKKFYNGDFGEPGLGGRETPVVTAPPGSGHAINPAVSYSARIGRYVMAYAVNDYTEFDRPFPIDSGIYLAFSNDGVQWSAEEQILPAWSIPLLDREIAIHPSIIWDDVDGKSGAGWLVYGYSQRWGHGSGAVPHYMAAQRIFFSSPELTPVQPTLLAYEGFAYPLGGLANKNSGGSVGFRGLWTTQFGATNVSPESLAYPDLSRTGNHAVQGMNSRTRRRLDLDESGPWAEYLEPRQVTEAGITSTRPLIGADGTQLYVSFLQQVSVNEGFYAMEFQRGDYASQELDHNRVLFVGYNGGWYCVESDFNGGVSQPLGIPNSDPNMIMLKFNFGTANQDSVSVYRNPSLSAEPSTPNAVLYGDFAFDRVSFANVISSRNLHRIDEIRFGVSYDAAVGIPYNAFPTLEDVADPVPVPEDSGEQNVPLYGISAGGGESQPLEVKAVSSNAALIPNPTVTYTSPNATGSLSYAPVANQSGMASITVTVTDGGVDENLNTTGDNGNSHRTFTVTVTPVNDPPTLNAIADPGAILEDAGPQTVNLSGIAAGGGESQPLRVTAVSSNTGLIPDPTVNYTSPNATGSVSYASVSNQSGIAVITVTVTDGGLDGNLSTAGDNGTVERTFTVTVTAANDPPVLGVIGAKAVDEGQLLSLTATATDADIPANTLTFSLDSGAPAGAIINATTGVFTWTPTESQGPGTHNVTVRVTDNGTPARDDFETIAITVAEVNVAPVLVKIGNKVVAETTELTFTATATDTDLPANTLTFSLVNAPPGASIDGSTGVFRWTPTEDHGPADYTLTVKVTDNGNPALADEEEITVTVVEGNLPPVLGAIGNKTIAELTQLTFTAAATDSDLPPDTLTFSLVNAPAGAVIDGASGAFRWTPTEAQGPGDFTFTVRVTDNGTPALSDEEQITVTVSEMNVAPVLGAIGAKSVNETQLLSFTATATDADLPANTLTFSLDTGAPAGARINATTGVFGWTPTEAQGPGTYNVTVRVTDNGTPVRDDFETIAITVAELNVAPMLDAIGAKAVDEGQLLTFTATATDVDIPANTLTFSLDSGAPAGAIINATTGVFTWTPTESQGPGTYSVTVRVTDNGTPVRDDFETIAITVAEVNVAPVLVKIGNKVVAETTELTFTAADADLPANTLTFSLVNAPPGASIDGSTGTFRWTPTEAQGPADYTLTVKVTDNEKPAFADEEEITVTVSEVNVAPVLGAIGAKSVNETQLLSFTATATDADLPANTLTFSLDSDAPAGASINPTTGVFSWTPIETQGPGTYSVIVRVTDNGAPARDDFETIAITVAEVNVAPVLVKIGNKAVAETTELTFTVTAKDADLPANRLTFSLVNAPPGASIDGSTGVFVFRWTPTEAQGPGDFTFTVRVTDDGTLALFDEEQITVTVSEVNLAPVLDAIGAKAVDEGQLLTFTATATDVDIPANTLTFSLDATSRAAGMTITTGGAFAWTPTEAQGGADYTVTIMVMDDGTNPASLTDWETFLISVAEVNVAPVLDLIGNKTVDERQTLTFTAIATDVDQPVNILSYSLDAAAIGLGMTINSTTGAFSWTPTKAQGPASYDVTITVEDNGTPPGSDSETFAIEVIGPTWQNRRHACDVTGDGNITAEDVLVLINDINARGSRDLTSASLPTSAPPPFLDPSGDSRLSPVDVLIVISYINTYGSGPIPTGSGGEGEHVPILDIYPRLRFPDTDAPVSTLPVDSISGRPETVLVGSSRPLAFCQPGERPAMVTAARQECLPRRSPVGVSPKSWMSPGPARSARLPDGMAELPSDTLAMEEAITAIACEVGKAWRSSS